jgi:putative hydrolase of the HAD superfamily
MSGGAGRSERREAVVEVVLFDLGGVLVELGGLPELEEFAGGGASEEALWRRWLACPWVRRFERGLCGPEEFSRGMVETWSMSVGPETFLEAFTTWPRGLLPGARELVHATRSRVCVGCLSNTNALHAERQWRELGIDDLFHERFLSHEMGLVKPDRDAFDHVVERLGRPAERVLFLDDNQINVDGARAAGLRAERAVGVPEARAILQDLGLLPL